MNKWSQRKRMISTLTKQGINCWLAYVLSQPVDVDLNVVAFLIRDYLGVTSIKTRNDETGYFFSVSVSEEEKEESFEKVIA